jgi:hypothetical protein
VQYADVSSYVAHLGSTSAASAFNSLLKADVFGSDDISKSMTIDQDGRSIKILGESANVHIAEGSDKLQLYVPKSKERQWLCLSRELPFKLLKHFGVRNLESAAEVGAIINAPNLAVVDQLLKDAGIIELDDITRPEDDVDVETRSLGDDSSTPSIIHTPISGSSPVANTNEASISTPATSVSSYASPSPVRRARPGLYAELLNSVMQQAEALSDLPKAGENISAPGEKGNTLETSTAVASSIQWGQESKIGAAGELFVSKIIKAIQRFLTTNGP